MTYMVTIAEQPNGDHEGTSSSSFGIAGSFTANELPVSELSRSGRAVTLNLTAAASSARITPLPPYAGNPEIPEVPLGKARNLFLVWLIATLRLTWSSLRHPGHPVVIDRRTGHVWLKSD